MSLSGFQIDWKKVVGVALDASICSSAWKLFEVVKLMAGSVIIAAICSTLFLVAGLATHRVTRAQTVLWHVLAILLVYSFKGGPALAYSVEMHANEIEAEMTIGRP